MRNMTEHKPTLSTPASTQPYSQGEQRARNNAWSHSGLIGRKYEQRRSSEGEERQLMLRLEELAGIEGLRENKTRTKIPSSIQALIDSKAAEDEVLKHDGSVELSADWEIGAGHKILAGGKSIDCPTYISIKGTSQSEGDIHLSDATNWGISKALIKMIRVVTSSTDWDLYILQNDNGYAVDDANIPRMQIMGAGSGNAIIHLDLPYEDEDDTYEVHLYFADNSGSNTADIYTIGYEMV